MYEAVSKEKQSNVSPDRLLFKELIMILTTIVFGASHFQVGYLPLYKILMKNFFYLKFIIMYNFLRKLEYFL